MTSSIGLFDAPLSFSMMESKVSPGLMRTSLYAIEEAEGLLTGSDGRSEVADDGEVGKVPVVMSK